MRGRLWNTLNARWRPAALTTNDTVMATIALMVAAVVRAFDYSTGAEAAPSPVPLTLAPAEAFMPMWAWAAAFGVGALVMLGGTILRRHFAVWLGHSLLIFPYAGLGVGILGGALMNPPWFDGIRSASILLLGMTFLHVLLAIRTGPRPLNPSVSHPVETVAAGGDGDG